MALKAQGVPILGVAYKDVRQPDQPKAFLDRFGDPFTAVLLDPDGRAVVDFGVTGPPETFLVDSSGKIIAKYIGPLTPEQAETLAEKVRPLASG